MNRATPTVLAVAFAWLAAVAVAWSWSKSEPPAGKPALLSRAAEPVHLPGVDGKPGTSRVSSEGSRQTENLSSVEKAGRIASIKRDYEDIRAKASADYTDASTAFPGGLDAFLRQLALIEREKRGDFAALLTPQEIENLELRDTAAGHIVQELVGDTSATEDQRRAAFRVQREFEDRFALTFDSAPAALLERERARCELQEKVRGLLGDSLFADWLRGEGAEFGHFTKFVAQQGLPAPTAMDLWRAKNEFTLRRLEITAQANVTVDQSRAAYAELARQTQARVMAILGAGAMRAASHEVLGWLPRT